MGSSRGYEPCPRPTLHRASPGGPRDVRKSRTRQRVTAEGGEVLRAVIADPEAVSVQRASARRHQLSVATTAIAATGSGSSSWSIDTSLAATAPPMPIHSAGAAYGNQAPTPIAVTIWGDADRHQNRHRQHLPSGTEQAGQAQLGDHRRRLGRGWGVASQPDQLKEACGQGRNADRHDHCTPPDPRGADVEHQFFQRLLDADRAEQRPR